jgi:hypothetical protein
MPEFDALDVNGRGFVSRTRCGAKCRCADPGSRLLQRLTGTPDLRRTTPLKSGAVHRVRGTIAAI